MKRFLCLLFVTLSLPLLAEPPVDKTLLAELDSYISQRGTYDARKQETLSTLRSHLRRARTDEARFDCCMDLADAYFAYQFDSTQYYLKAALEYAAGDEDLQRTASIRLGYLYVKAGSYMEAYDRLYIRTDTTLLSDAQKVDYYFALFEFSRDLSGNSGMVERLSIPDRAVYRTRLFELLEPESELYRRLEMDELMASYRYVQADSVGRLLLGMVSPFSRNAAIYHYDLSESAWQQHNEEEQFRQLIWSAEADLVNAVHDYASLTIIAQIIINTDLDRSFHYLRIAQEDALAYNSKLRPWQISQFFLNIEQKYEERQAELARMRVLVVATLSVLVLLLGIAMYATVRQTRKLRKAQRRLQEAGKLKEAYIAQFLGYLSANVAQLRQEDHHTRKLLKQGRSEELLKEISTSTRTEDALEHFYRIFDETFLGIYPDFVAQFNALLKPEAQVHPKKGDLLSTELRIFALIRLGITDSKEIASLLHYSVSTIYNYKVSVKNGALGDRDDFEEAVKRIGK